MARVIPGETHPPLTWGQVKDWAKTNGITDDHVVIDQDHRPVRDVSETETGSGRPAFMFQRTWG